MGGEKNNMDEPPVHLIPPDDWGRDSKPSIFCLNRGILRAGIKMDKWRSIAPSLPFRVDQAVMPTPPKEASRDGDGSK